MASWAMERRRMTVPPDELSKAEIEHARNLLAWSASGPVKTFARFEKEDLLRPVRETGRSHRH